MVREGRIFQKSSSFNFRIFHKSSSFNLRKMFEIPGRQAHSLVLESGTGAREAMMDERLLFRSQGGKTSSLDSQAEQIGSVYNPSTDKGPVSRLSKDWEKTGALANSKDSKHPSGMCRNRIFYALSIDVFNEC